MSTRYAVASGNWSHASAVWSDTDGGAPGSFVPVDGDTFVILAGVSVKMDVDQSAWTGLAGVNTIRGGVTPGMLYWDDSASGILRIRTGASLVGTTSTNRGRLLVNSDGVWANSTALQQATKAIIRLEGTAVITAVNLDIKLVGSVPTTKYVELYGTLYTCADQTTGVNTTTGVITFGAAPPIAGTLVCVRSSGTLPTGLKADVMYYVRSVSGNTCKLSYANSDSASYVIIPSATGSGTMTMYAGHTNTTSKSCNVIQDVTGESAYWTAAADQDRVSVVDWVGMATDQQRDKLAGIAWNAITITTNNIGAKQPMARCYLLSRNVSIRSSGTGPTLGLIDYGTATHAGVYIGCEICNTYEPGTHTQHYSVGINKGGGHTITDAVFWGLYYGIAEFAAAATITGWFVSCYCGIFYCNYANATVTFAGCSVYGWRLGSGMTATIEAFGCYHDVSNVSYGTFSGVSLGNVYQSQISNGSCTYTNMRFTNCQTAVNACTGCFFDAEMEVCYSYAYQGCAASMIDGSIQGANYAVYLCTQCTFYATATKGWSGLYQSNVMACRGSSVSSMASADYIPAYYRTRHFGVTFASAVQILNYRQAYLDIDNGTFVEDLGGNDEYIGGWTLGGYVKTYSWASAESSFGELGTPPVTEPLAVNVQFFEDSDRDCFWEIPLQGVAGQQITVTCYVKLSTTSDWTTLPKVCIDDPGQAYLQSGWELASAQATSTTSWQTVTLTYTPSKARSLLLRFKGRGGNAGGTGTNKAFWFWAISQGSGSPGGGEHAYVFAC
jgi:hypothetical protein